MYFVLNSIILYIIINTIFMPYQNLIELQVLNLVIFDREKFIAISHFAKFVEMDDPDEFETDIIEDSDSEDTELLTIMVLKMIPLILTYLMVLKTFQAGNIIPELQLRNS